MGSKKRHIILAALVLSLATAVYLNWQFSSNKELTSTDSIMSTKELGQAQFVNNSQKCEAKPENSEEDKDNAEESKESSDDLAFSKISLIDSVASSLAFWRSVLALLK